MAEAGGRDDVSGSEDLILPDTELRVRISWLKSSPYTDEEDDPLMCHACNAKATQQAELGPAEPEILTYGDYIFFCNTCMDLIAVDDYENFSPRFRFDKPGRRFFDHVRQRTVRVWTVEETSEESDRPLVQAWLRQRATPPAT